MSVGEAIFILGFLAAIASRLEYYMADEYRTFNAGTLGLAGIALPSLRLHANVLCAGHAYSVDCSSELTLSWAVQRSLLRRRSETL